MTSNNYLTFEEAKSKVLSITSLNNTKEFAAEVFLLFLKDKISDNTTSELIKLTGKSIIKDFDKLTISEQKQKVMKIITSFYRYTENDENKIDKYIINYKPLGGIKDYALNNIKTLRMKRGFTQTKLGELLNLNKGKIARLEDELNTTFDYSIINDLAKIFDVSIYEVIGIGNFRNIPYTDQEKLEIISHLYCSIDDIKLKEKIYQDYYFYVKDYNTLYNYKEEHVDNNTLDNNLEYFRKIRNISISRLALDNYEKQENILKYESFIKQIPLPMGAYLAQSLEVSIPMLLANSNYQFIPKTNEDKFQMIKYLIKSLKSDVYNRTLPLELVGINRFNNNYYQNLLFKYRGYYFMVTVANNKNQKEIFDTFLLSPALNDDSDNPYKKITKNDYDIYKKELELIQNHFIRIKNQLDIRIDDLCDAFMNDNIVFNYEFYKGNYCIDYDYKDFNLILIDDSYQSFIFEYRGFVMEVTSNLKGGYRLIFGKGEFEDPISYVDTKDLIYCRPNSKDYIQQKEVLLFAKESFIRYKDMLDEKAERKKKFEEDLRLLAKS